MDICSVQLQLTLMVFSLNILSRFLDRGKCLSSYLRNVFSNICLYIFVGGWVKPNYVYFSISLLWPVGVEFKVCCVPRSSQCVFIFCYATLIQIYKQFVRPIFEYGSVSTITASDNIISKIQQLQNKFIRLALCLPKYICSKLLHNSTGLPYVKDRVLSCAIESLDRIVQNPLVRESISSNRLNPAWDSFPMPLSVVRPVSP